MTSVSRHFTYEESLEWLRELEHSSVSVTLSPNDHSLNLYHSKGKLVSCFRLPLLFPQIQKVEDLTAGGSYTPLPRLESLTHYIQRIPEEPPSCILLLIRAGQAALGFVEDNELLCHKVIRKYMVRKKQGKAQLTYLRQKGKSRAGSRVRLANSVAFFEDINQKLHEWDVEDHADRIFYSCNPRMWGHLFRASTKPPFSSEDRRLRKLGFDFHEPNFEALQRIQRWIQKGTLTPVETESTEIGKSVT